MGLGVGVAVGLVAELYKGLTDANKEMRALDKEFKQLGNSPSPASASIEAINAHLEKSIALAEKANKSLHGGFFDKLKSEGGLAFSKLKQGPLALLTEGVLNPMGLMGTASDKFTDKRDEANKRAQDDTDALTEKTLRLVDVEKARVEYGEHAARTLEIRAKLEEEIGAIKRRSKEIEERTGAKPLIAGSIYAAQKEAETKQASEDRTFEAKQREIAETNRLAAIDKTAGDAGIKAANVKLEAAREAYRLAPKEEQTAASGKVAQAERDVIRAQKEYAEGARKALSDAIGEQVKLTTEAAEGDRHNADLLRDQEQEQHAKRMEDLREFIAEAGRTMQALHLRELGNIQDEKDARAGRLQNPGQGAKDRAALRRALHGEQEIDQIDKDERDRKNRGAHDGSHLGDKLAGQLQDRARGVKRPRSPQEQQEQIHDQAEAAFRRAFPHHPTLRIQTPINITPKDPVRPMTPGDFTQAFDASKLAGNIQRIADAKARFA